MAFIHHPRARPARDRHSPPPSHEPTSAPRASYSKTSQDNAHDWSIVFPGRVKQTATSAHDSDEPLSDSAASATPSSPADPFQPDPQTGLALSLPPLHDGTGRFAGASETSASPAADDVVSLRSPLSPQSDIYTESVFSATDSHDDADGEVGFGSGSDFESDAIASVPSGPTAARRPRSKRRSSRLSARSDAIEASQGVRPPHPGRHADGEEKPSATARATPQESSLATSLGASRAGSWLSGNQSIASTLDHVSVVPSVASSRSHLGPADSQHGHRSWPGGLRALSVISTSDSEQDAPSPTAAEVGREADAASSAVQARYEDELASSNLAQSAGLVPGAGSHLLWRRPKRRHRNPAAGRSSKRSNTSQSQSAIHRSGSIQPPCAVVSESGLSGRRSRRSMAGNASRRAGSTSGRSIPKEGPAASTKLVRKLLKKIFDLEPEVLDAFLSRDASVDHVDGRPRPLSTSLSSSRDLAGPGFSHERGLDAPLAHIPAPPRRAGSSSGDERQQMLHVGRSADDQASEDASDEDGEGSKTPRASLHESQDWQRQDVALINSPLFDLTTSVRGERAPLRAATELGLTAEALSRRRTSSGGSRQSQQVADGARSMLEPTTIEALQALVNSMMPVPMPFRILGALARSLGWSRSFWGGGGQDADEAASREQAEGEAAELPAVLDDDRRYRYDRLLSVQQAKAWSRRYRGIQLANDQPEDSSIDVPECWRGDEHPALAGNSP